MLQWRPRLLALAAVLALVMIAVVGGWGLNSIYTLQTGAPIAWVNGSTNTPGDYVYFGDKITVNPRETNVPAFNLSAFDTKSADQPQYHVRTFSTTFPNLRADGINEWSPSISRRTRGSRERRASS